MISVIMSAYNAEKTVCRAAESILHGTYEDLELIMADDGSSDSTYAILQDIARQDSRCVCIRNTANKGLACSLNACLSAARGELVARMDADDCAFPERLRVQADFLTSHPDIGFVGSAAYLFHAGEIYGVRQFEERPSPSDLVRHNPFIHPSILFRRSCLQSVGGYRDSPFTHRCEDYDLFFRLYAKGIRGYNLPKPLLLYEEDPADTSKHTIRSRICEFCTRLRGSAGLKKPLGFLLSFKSLAAVFVPRKLYLKIRSARKENKVL